MKTYLIALLIFSFTFTMSAQKKSENRSMTTTNANYLSKVYAKDNAIKVNKLQNLASQYDIANSDVYKPKSNNTYDVVFEESNCKIVATYNSNSEIIKSDETFNKIRLPNKLAVKIAKEYPGWKIENKSYHISYTKDEAVTKIFSVTVDNNSNKKTLKFSLVEKPDMTYVVVN